MGTFKTGHLNGKEHCPKETETLIKRSAFDKFGPLLHEIETPFVKLKNAYKGLLLFIKR